MRQLVLTVQFILFPCGSFSFFGISSFPHFSFVVGLYRHEDALVGMDVYAQSRHAWGKRVEMLRISVSAGEQRLWGGRIRMIIGRSPLSVYGGASVGAAQV